MTNTIAFVRLVPWALLGRLGAAAVEIAVAAVIVSGSVVIGHALRDWRAWYGDPATTHPWAPAAATSAAARTPMPAATPMLPQPVVAPATAVPVCRPSSGRDVLVFISPAPLGPDCVWLLQQPDGTHVAATTLGGTTDLGPLGAPPPAGIGDLRIAASTQITPFWPAGWQGPVIAVVGHTGSGNATAVVFTWRGHAAAPLLRVTGADLRVASDPAGWPRVTLTRGDGVKSTYGWDGRVFSER